ncbi:pilus assembly protein [Shewanella sp.]|uniref:pilus assembly protein n=1 Tax=Shewanella sp. TaxID=50422 RepID=UPI003A974A6B
MRSNKLLASVWSFALVLLASQAPADDTELYVNANATEKPNVLIIFDNSGSMDTLETGVAASYDPNQQYDAVGSSNSYQGRMIYFTVGSGMDNSSLPVPDSPSESRRFNDAINACTAAKSALDRYGRFTGYIREYITKGNGKGTWQPLKENSGAELNNPVDCFEDIESELGDNNNRYQAGFPQNSVRTGGDYDPWGDTADMTVGNQFLQGEQVTLYTDNYLRWYTLYQNGQLGTTSVSRLDIAKDAIKGIIGSMSSVNFGVAVFNKNYPYEGDRDGGRVIASVKPRTISEKEALISSVNNLDAETNTPLCETLFEAYRYFSGGAVQFGHRDVGYRDGNTPPYDASAEVPNQNRYDSPLGVCSDVAYIIYITDGEPTLDHSADDLVRGLVSGADSNGEYGAYTYGYEYSRYGYTALQSYMPSLASYMYHNDQIPATTSFQRVVTHTIGFALDDDSNAEPLLIETARRGGGQYFAANSVASLQSALSTVLDEVTRTGQRFSAPGVAVNNADPTRTLDSAYYAVFLPSLGPRWSGNLKKFKVSAEGAIVDANNVYAINSDGGIKDRDNGDANTACSVWSDCNSPDGNKVEEGGVARKINPQTRNLLSDLGAGLVPLTQSAASSFAGGDTELASYMGLDMSVDSTSTALDKAFRWIKGYNVDRDEAGDYTSTDYNGVRGDIMGDPLHSRPLVIDYGSSGSGSNIMIYMGTNHGYFHAFHDTGTDVSESWAFMPYELLPNVQTLRENNYSNGHSVYGIDGSPVAYIERSESGSVSKAWLFVGMRRGGSSYFGFDVTTPNAPRLLWHIDSNTSGFAELAQSWSTPVVTKLPDSDEPVVIFGGGYNLGYDANTGTNSDGRAVFVVNAETGVLKHTFGVGGDIALPGIENGIAAQMATLDSDSNGVTDRIYAADLGGNIWRLDMPTADPSLWSGFKFAALSGATESTTRRFFNAPVIAQTYVTNLNTVTYIAADGTEKTTNAYENTPLDALAIGSGNRAGPLSTTSQDMFFVLQDRNIISQSFGGSGNAAVPDALTVDDLYDVTSTIVDTDSENLAFGQKRGWHYDFTAVGEKSLSRPTIYDGYVYFTSFVPAQTSATTETCLISSTGRLYSFGLAKGYRSAVTEYEEICKDCIPPELPPITPPTDEGETSGELLFILGSGECDASGDNCTGTITPKSTSPLSRYRLYYHVNE